MKSTSPLNVLSDFSMDDRTVHIHPNDGFDLGLMTTEYVVRLYVGDSTDPDQIDESAFAYGKILLKNSVRGGQVELGLKAAEKLNGSRSAVLRFATGEKYGTLLVNPSS
ncbi:MAG: hypothetical protein EA382_15165 [Spirochaetaceae bacterium]|nr:MAG: hypothetical protein EA382_15165 [Spirochaetaceae bacterium]